MRPISEIRADIDKLVKELDEVKAHDAKRNSAVHILSNLGWTHTPKDGWKKPEAAAVKFDEYKPEWGDGDFVLQNGQFFRVFRSTGLHLTVQQVMRVSALGVTVSPYFKTLDARSVQRVSIDKVKFSFAYRK